jgi:phospho-N-acetylmuramoyl-pentapeptide-transferase
MIIDIVKIFIATTMSFCIGMLFTPILTNWLYRNKMWKKKAGKIATDGRETPIFNALHKDKEVGVPKLGGSVIWVSALTTTFFLFLVAFFIKDDIFSKLDFLSRDQTWIPVVTLLLGALIGMVDDLLEIKGNGDYKAGGLSLKKRVGLVFAIGILIGLWFYQKLDVAGFNLFGGYYVELGVFFVLFFAFVMVFMYSGGVIDGIDGLAGGVFAVAFCSYAGIAFSQEQINLAAFCGSIAGGLLAFLWFNIPPARFYMSETGTMALTITLTVVAFMTDSLGGGRGLLVLPIIALPLIVTSLSDIIQLASKKFRNGKKVFLVAPLHHHFEALGWSGAKVTMRYWVLSFVFGIIGLCFALI